MVRIILFLVLIALAALGAAWVADQSGDVTLSWGGTRVETSLPVFALALGVLVVASVLAWSILRGLWRTPQRIRHARRERRHARGRHAITHGLLAIGHGDSTAARLHADAARRHAGNDPLALLLHAQSAQLDGDREGAKAAFRAMAEREDTRLLGLRGLFIEAQRADDPVAAVMIAEEALKLAPFTDAPTQRVAMLMAEIERTEHGDSGRARAWTLRAVRALPDSAWTADGYVSDHWRPVSPVSGRLDAFQWQRPLAALPSDKNAAIDMAEFNQAMSAPRRVEPPREPAARVEPEAEPQPPAAQDNSPVVAAVEPAPMVPPTPVSAPAPEPPPPAKPSPPAAESAPVAPAPLFRSRQDIPNSVRASILPVIPIVRAPDDPGIDEDEPPRDEFAEQLNPGSGQAGGWRGFLTRWGG